METILALLLLLLAMIAVPVLMLVEAWKILRKQGQPGWKSLIPIYGEYCIYAASGAGGLFWKQILAAVGGSILSGVTTFVLNLGDDFAIVGLVVSLLSLALSIYSLLCAIRMQKVLARSFGKGVGFAWGLILMGIVFRGILAFSRDAVFQAGASRKNAVSQPLPEPTLAHPLPEPVIGAFPNTGADPIQDFSHTVSAAPDAVDPLALTTPLPMEQMQRFLRCQSGACAGGNYLLCGTVTLGRAPTCQIQVCDPSVSGNHCRFFWRDSKLFVMDLGSTNGTAVEGFGKIPANVPVELREGDTITVGRNNVFSLV